MNSMMLKQKMEKQIFDESLNLLQNNASAPLPNFPNEQCGWISNFQFPYIIRNMLMDTRVFNINS